jgi:2-dehydropantoate 2-reductase
MEILVYGAGAVGGYLGARLLQQNHQVTMIAREVTVDLVKMNGLSITENGERERVKPNMVTSAMAAFQDGRQYDLIIMSVKSYDLEDALNSIVAFCPQPPTILITGNGIGIEEPFMAQFGAEKVIAGSVTTPLSKQTSDHIVVQKAGRGLALAPTQPKQNIKQWGALFHKAGISTQLESNYQAMKWSKALLNMVGNATSAILNRKPGVLYKSDTIFNLEVQMLQEVLAVMKAKKLPVIDLPGSSATKLAFGVRRLPRSMLKSRMVSAVTSGRGDKMPSFQIDLTSGKGKSEVIYHNGAVAEAGQAVGIAAPVNAALNDILLKLTREELNWREFDGRPQRLLAEVKKYQNP